MQSAPYLAYLRVSTSEQADSGAGLAAQRAAILAEARKRGWSEVRFIEDAGYSGKDTRRPGLRLALEVLKRGEAAGLVVAKMDRLSRSMLDFTSIMGTAQRQGWVLLALDCPADPSTPMGEAVANVMMTFAQLERSAHRRGTRGQAGGRRPDRSAPIAPNRARGASACRAQRWGISAHHRRRAQRRGRPDGAWRQGMARVNGARRARPQGLAASNSASTTHRAACLGFRGPTRRLARLADASCATAIACHVGCDLSLVGR